VGEVRDLEKLEVCVFQANYRFVWVVKCRCKVLVGLVVVSLWGVMVVSCCLLGFIMVIMCVCLFLFC